MTVHRRDFLRGLGVAGTAAVTLGGVALGRPGRGLAQVLPKSGGKRLVVIGAGFGGNFAALTVKRLVPDAEVVILERAPFFISCPATLEYVFGFNSLDTITFGYSPLIAKGIRVIRTEVVAVEPDAKRVVTAQGAVDYDQLLVATGIRLAYEEIPGLAEAYHVNASIYDKGTPIIDTRHKIDAFQGGTVVLNSPAVPYKCPPGPYEYALLWAEHIKKKNLSAKVVLLDAKPDPIPPPNKQAFLDAMAARRDVLEYRPQTKITGIDGEKKVVRTDAGDLPFAFLSIIPPNRAAGFIKEAGLGPVFAEVDVVTFRSTKNPNVYAVGDAAQTPFAKSAYTASVSGKIVGTYIAKALGASVPDPAPPHNICYPYTESDKAFLTRADWSYETKDGKVQVNTKITVDNAPKPTFAQLRKAWEQGLWREMFQS
ncbi:MAG TPA: FAD-dependent oxidoreductase [Methylomirabilota bacterium]|jgi:NADPH-dependent 2,4-dienoyl-CoA reductase/sulfur reductase-like enzyme|nr:FAD-dependent oxidoreductase [Methylomirabilota bacterium]